ncbi:hypothetical protein ACFLUV_01280 [Elusimicrobiota bacterium]
MNKKANKHNKEKEIDKKPARKITLTGIGILILGFIVLGMVNSMASNWAGFAAPVLILAGWITIAVGLWKSE